MSEDFDKLKEVGAQKIHEVTHISRVHVEAILHDNFDNISKVQLFGFISILEREYALDLSNLKNRAVKHFDAHVEESNEQEKINVFQSSKKKINLTPIYIAIVIVIFASFMLLNINSSQSEVSEVIKVDNSAIESAKNNLSTVVVDKNSSTESNQADKVTKQVNLDSVTESKQANEVKKVSDEIVSFKIIPNVEVWLGYIDLQTHKRYQKTFLDEFSLDSSKDWLLSFGHGHINIEINGIIKKYEIKKNVRFSYINSELKEIDLEEFKSLNRGNRW